MNTEYTFNLHDYLTNIIKDCDNKAEFARRLNIDNKAGNYQIIDLIIKENNLDISHFKVSAWNKGKKYHQHQYKLEDVLIKDSPYLNTNSLKKRLIREGLKEHKCELCGYSDKVEMHHINGDSRDNRLENLQIICPNCHAKTNTYRGRNVKGRKHYTPEKYILTNEDIRIRDEARVLAKKLKCSINKTIEMIQNSPNKSIQDFKDITTKKKKNIKICKHCGKEFTGVNSSYCSIECYNAEQGKNIPSKQQLIESIIDTKCNFSKISRQYNVSDNTIKKWCKRYDMPYCKYDLINWININTNNNVPQVLPKKSRKYDDNLIIKIYNEGYNQKEIANYINCSCDYVRKVLKENNIEIRKSICNKIGQYTLDNKFIQYFWGTSKCAEWLVDNNIASLTNVTSHIIDNCNNKTKSAYGYIWRYVPLLPIENIK